MNYTSRLLKFQDQIIICKQFDLFWTDLITLCQQEDFLLQSISAIYPALQNILEQFALQRIHHDAIDHPKVNNMILMHYAPANFFHGICHINGHMTCIIYFANTGVGMISLCESFFPPETTLTRFCLAPKQCDEQLQ